MVRSLLTLIIATMVSTTLRSQVIIGGRVTSLGGEALARINIMVYLPDDRSLIAFALSDEKGNFKTSVNAPTDSLIVKVSSINYKNESRRVANVSQQLVFKLAVDVKELEGIKVIAPAIEKHGDTLTYFVKSFAHNEDRAIEDVLKRMPGIEVETNGQILYQGMPINKFYVEGLDLMESRYTMVSKNLPKGSVTEVEVLENHQPMRMLQDKVTSQQAALNLKIKKGVSTTGTASLAAGMSPFLWDVNITPMTFTKSLQVLSSLQSNNTGNDVSKQINELTYDNIRSAADRPTEKINMLNVLAASPPEISSSRYLDNHIVLMNFNMLQSLSPEVKLRSNIYFTYDEQQAQTSMIRTMYTPADTLQFSEQFENQLTNKNLYAKFNINRNVKKNYLNNDIKIQSGWDTQGGTVITGGNQVVQALQNPLKSFSNELKSFNPIGKHIWQIQSYFLYDQNPHNLAVKPGQFEAQLNDSMPYNRVTQKTDIKRLYTDNSAGLVLGIKRFTIKPRAGIIYQQQQLLSRIKVNTNNTETEMDPAYANDIKNKHLQAYLLTDIEYKTRKITFYGNFSLNTHKLEVTDAKPEYNQHLTRLLTDNSLSVEYRITGFWRAHASYGYNENISDFNEMYSGFIMKNYRNLSQNLLPVSTTRTQVVSSRIEYRNQIISFFNILSYVYSASHMASTSSSLINDDGSAIITSQGIPQTTATHFVQAYTSKYFSAAKTTLSLRVHYMQQKGTSVVNAETFNTCNRVVLVKPDISVHITPWMNLDYNLDASTIRTLIDLQQKSSISLLKHNIGFFFFPKQNQLFNFTTEYYRHNATDNIFVDMMYRYTFTKQKVDLELKCSNIFNSRSYTSFLANSFSVWETTYLLRPFQVIASVKFSF